MWKVDPDSWFLPSPRVIIRNNLTLSHYNKRNLLALPHAGTVVAGTGVFVPQLAHQKNTVYKYLIQAHFSFWFLLQNKRSSAKTNTSAAYIKCEYVGEMGGKRRTHKIAAVHKGRRIMPGTHPSRRKSGVMDGTLNKMESSNLIYNLL